VRHVACILPFEKELLDIHNVPCSYVGHPIAEEVHFQLEKEEFARFYGLNPNKKWIGFFPGSRNNELIRMLPVFLETIQGWDSSEHEFLFSKAKSVSHQFYLDLLEKSKDKKASIIDGYTYEMMKYCDFLIVTSGTATLEAAYIGTPLLIVYKTSPISYQIGKYLVRIKRIGLPNIVMDDDVLPEMVQSEVNAPNIHKTANEIMNDPERYARIKDKLKTIKALLGEKKATTQMSLLIQDLLRIDV
jgi:lipid-A-disaccharide synthase